MILQQLAEDADAIIWETLQETLSPPMYDRLAVRWFLNLDATGRPAAVPFTPLVAEGKSGNRGIDRLIPSMPRSGTRPPPMLLVDTVPYVFGVGEDARAAEKHDAFKQLVAQCANATDEPSVRAVQVFLDAYTPGSLEMPEGMDDSHRVAFRVGDEGTLPFELPSVQQFWFAKSRPSKPEAAELQCLVCGNLSPIPEFLPLKIKGIPGGQSAGTSLVSANENAYESYGLSRARTSPVCDRCAERSHKALNALLRSDSHHLVIGGMVYAFWSPSGWSPVDRFGRRSKGGPGAVKKRLDQPRSGKVQRISHPERLAAFGLSASGGRAVVRSAIRTTVSEAERHLDRWENWQRLVQPDGERPVLHSAYFLAASIYRDIGSDDCQRTTQFLIESGLSGTPLPNSLLAAAIRRIRAVGFPVSGRDTLAAYSRAALVKMVLASQRGIEKGDTWMTQIETGDKNPAAYHWGRLLAVLEAIQRKALEKPGNPLNSTLVDRNYGAASTAPGTVFGRLFSGAQDHLKKIRIVSRGTAEAFQKQIEGIVSGHLVPEDGDPLQGLQRRFTVQEQALFALGYYHQRAKNRADARIGRAKRDAAGEESTEPAEENEDEE